MTEKISNICPQDEFCGGCIYQGVPYEEQLKAKEGEVRALLAKNKVEPEVFDHISTLTGIRWSTPLATW